MGHLHDVCLVHGSDLLPTIVIRIAECKLCRSTADLERTQKIP